MSYNLDENISEYFEFTIKGFSYRMRYVNTEEAAEMSKLGDEGSKGVDYLFSFITSVSPDAPLFNELYKTLTVPHIVAFTNMIKKEFGVANADN